MISEKIEWRRTRISLNGPFKINHKQAELTDLSDQETRARYELAATKLGVEQEVRDSTVAT